MIKAAKKLKKLWPKKKRTKRPFPHSNFYYLPPPPPLRPPQYHYQCYCSHSNSPIEPSAPPLPPWLEETTVEQKFAEFGYDQSTDHEFECDQEEIVVETNQINDPDPLLSYQQYTVSNPVYGVPVQQQQEQQQISPRRERKGGFFGCFVKFGVVLIRCFCPCFHVRQVD